MAIWNIGKKNGMWKGGKVITSHGYILIRVGATHHLADSRGYAYEHRLVAEKKLGRRLKEGEQVHHKNGDKQNNAPENLQIMPSLSWHKVAHRTKGLARRLPDESNSIIKCRCGCNMSLSKYDESGRPREYVSGHNLQDSPTINLVLNALIGGQKTVRELTNLHPTKSKRAIATTLSKLKKRGLVRNVKRGVWISNEQNTMD